MATSEIKIYYPDTIEYQPFTSEAVQVINDTGSTSSKTASGTETQGGTEVSKTRKFPPRPTPIPVVAKELISNSLNTQSKQILSNYTFNKTGSLQIGEYEDGVSGDIKISPNGIVARNASNVITVSIDGTTGDATFLGTVLAGSVISAEISANLITGTIVNAQIASIDWAKITNVQVENADILSLSADKLTAGTIDANLIDVVNLDADNITSGTIDADTINVDNLNADNITQGDVGTNRMRQNVLNALKLNVSELSAITANIGTITAGTITGIVITGGTIRTSALSTRVEMSASDNEMRIYNGGTKIIQMDEGGMWVRGGNVIGLGGTSAGLQTCQIYENGSFSGNLVISAGNVITLNGDTETNTLLVSNSIRGATLTTTSWASFGGDVDMNGKIIKELNSIEWNTRSSNPGVSWALYMYSSGGTYNLRTRMNGSTWKVDQTSA